MTALVWFVASAPLTRPITFQAGTTVQDRPIPATRQPPAYVRAQQVYARRVASARSQARTWKLVALGSAALCGILAVEVFIGVASSPADPHVIEVDAAARGKTQLSFTEP